MTVNQNKCNCTLAWSPCSAPSYHQTTDSSEKFCLHCDHKEHCHNAGLEPSTPTAEPLYLLEVKPAYLSGRARYHAPDHRGYTNDISKAGRFPKQEAEDYAKNLPDKLAAIPEPAEPEGELLPCPFCGSTQIKHCNGVHVQDYECLVCGAIGPDGNRSPLSALQRWNTRRPLDDDAIQSSVEWNLISSPPTEPMLVIAFDESGEAPTQVLNAVLLMPGNDYKYKYTHWKYLILPSAGLATKRVEPAES